MEPKNLKKILDTSEGRALAKYLSRLAVELDSIDGITLDDPVEATIEMKARQRASAKFRQALSTLLIGDNTAPAGDNRDDYSINV